jgi:hypothetical protein
MSSNAGGGGGGVAGFQPMRTAAGAQMNFGGPTPYLTYGCILNLSLSLLFNAAVDLQIKNIVIHSSRFLLSFLLVLLLIVPEINCFFAFYFFCIKK